MEARVSVLEQIAKDNRDTFRVIQDAILRLGAKMDAGFARLDARIEGVRDKQERDFRLSFAALVAVALGPATLIAHGFHWIP